MHALSEVDNEALTAICATCGPTRFYLSANGSRRCSMNRPLYGQSTDWHRITRGVFRTGTCSQCGPVPLTSSFRCAVRYASLHQRRDDPWVTLSTGQARFLGEHLVCPLCGGTHRLMVRFHPVDTSWTPIVCRGCERAVFLLADTPHLLSEPARAYLDRKRA